MIKQIMKIDIHGNEYLQEVVICNRCKKIINAHDYVHEIRWCGAHPVKIEPGYAYGLSPEAAAVKDICSDCKIIVDRCINGEDFDSTTLQIRNDLATRSLADLLKRRNSACCGIQYAQLIDEEISRRRVNNVEQG